MNKDTQNMTLEMSCSEPNMEMVMKNIYTSCDPNNINLVRTSELIDFIRPFMLQDLPALETLKNMLDPENKDISIASENFYTVMNEWTQKIASQSEDKENDEFNRTPSQFNVLDENLLPFSQSTPRPSFGQKLLSCEGLLNLSNVSSYNLSPSKKTKEISIGGPEKTMLEEEVKQLNHQLGKVFEEVELLKTQLAFSEEQNEVLQNDVAMWKGRFQSEQQTNSHLQENKNCLEDLREDIIARKKRIEELNKKLTMYEKENAHLNMYVQKLEKENTELEESCSRFAKTEQIMRKEFLDLRTELEMKEDEVSSITKINEELRLRLCEKMTELEQLYNENEFLDYKQQDLEKILSSKLYSLPSHYNTCLDEMSSFNTRDQIGDGEPQPLIPGAGVFESLQTELFQVDPRFDQKDQNVSDFEYEDPISSLKIENESLQKRLETVEEEKKTLMEECGCITVKSTELEKKLNNLMLEKKQTGHVDGSEIVQRLTEDMQRLKDDFDKLQLELAGKNNELLSFENFESMYNDLKVEHGEKIRRIAELQQHLELAQNATQNLHERNEDLEKLLRSHKTELLQTKEKLERNDKLNLETSVAEFKATIETLRKEVKDEMDTGQRLKEKLKNAVGINDEVRSDNERLKSDLDALSAEYRSAMIKFSKSKTIAEEMKKENDDLLVKFERIARENKILSQRIEKEKSDERARLLDRLKSLKSTADVIKSDQEVCKEEILRKITDYENSLHMLGIKVKELECVNDALRTDLIVEKKKSLEEKYSDGDASSECSSVSLNFEKPKNLSFEKQKITIERLRKELRDEKSKCAMLRERLNADKTNVSEKQSLYVVVNDLNEKLRQQEEYYKRMCDISSEKIRDLSHQIASLSEKNQNIHTDLLEKDSLLNRQFEALEKSNTLFENLDKDLEKCKNVQNNLATDLAAKENNIREVSLENLNLKQFAESSQNKLLELSTKLTSQEVALQNYRIELEDKDEKISALSNVLLDRENKIKTLSIAAAAHEIQVSTISSQLTSKDEACLKLERELKTVNDILSRSIDIKEQPEINVDQSESGCLNGSVQNGIVSDKISAFTDIISECCFELNRTFTRFIEQWRSQIEFHPNFKQLGFIKLCQSLDIEDVLAVIIENITAVIVLLNILSSNNMEEDPELHLTFLKNHQNVDPSDSRPIKRFTLNPTKLGRSVGPDSAETEILPSIKQNNECEKENSRLVGQDFRNLFENIGEGENVCCYNSTAHLPLLSFDLQTEDAFPHVSEDILEKLGLHETSTKKKLTKEETEEVFTTFAIQTGLDSKNIRERLQHQRDNCLEKYKKYQYLLKDISVRLRDHRCIGASDPINPVFVLLEDVRFNMQDLMQSAGQLGMLTCEHRMTKCWNLVTNYMAILKQDIQAKEPKRCLPVKAKKCPAKEEIDKSETEKCNKEDKSVVTKKESKRHRSRLSNFTNCLIWISFVSLLFFIGVICIHWRCKMTTEYKICPLDDFFKIISQKVGNPPY